MWRTKFSASEQKNKKKRFWPDPDPRQSKHAGYQQEVQRSHQQEGYRGGVPQDSGRVHGVR